MRKISKAVDFLVALINETRQSGKDRLPTIKHMAQQAGVGLVVMWKAVGVLKNAGQLITRPGGGITIVSEARTSTSLQAVSSAVSSQPVTRAEQLQARIVKDLLYGVYPPGGMLPNIKELTGIYGVHYRTLRKALAPLVENGQIIPFMRSYRVPPVSSARHVTSIVLIAASDDAGMLHDWGPRVYEHYRILENECAKIQVSLVYVPLKTLIGDFPRYKGRWGGIDRALDADDIAGFMIWNLGMNSKELADLFAWLGRVAKDKPISLLDEASEEIVPKIVPGYGGSIKFFSMACGKRPGEDVGRYLLNLGHRKIAFISALNRTGWSRRRLEGLRDIYTAAGIPDGVIAFTLDNYIYLNDTITMSDADFVKVEKILKKGIRHTGKSDQISPRALGAFRDNITQLLQLEALSTVLRPLFDQALKEPGITAWVGSSDVQALDALDYLSRNHVAVPGEISVIGFDDVIEASVKNLTSYNFNSQAVIQAMIRHIFNRPGRLKQTEPQIVEIEGFLVERQTTCKFPDKPQG